MARGLGGRGTRPRLSRWPVFIPLDSTLRFLVPNDLRYVQCALRGRNRPAVTCRWGFGRFANSGAERRSGLIALNQRYRTEDGELCRRKWESLIAGVCESLVWRESTTSHSSAPLGSSGASFPQRARIPWLADIASQILQARERQSKGDARFSPLELAAAAGELLIRSSAMRSNTGAAPQFFVRGSPKDVPVEIGTARLFGLGSFVEVKRKGFVLNIPLQDTATGLVVSVCKETQTSEPFDGLAAAHFNKQFRYSAIASRPDSREGRKIAQLGTQGKPRAAYGSSAGIRMGEAARAGSSGRFRRDFSASIGSALR